ncbi:glycoside hydrolase family 79 protein [Rhizoctonia solani AG-3 Rhs1AP]|uniref:Glycoside hydrolase family 79 protein n=2 Tax=Rhizoctonia solani AG-3 TaxID=1086053 RepID=A0A074S4Z6_9AGAM|nr:glycoside hydrolase family 79 protein [Rhizoctonia solani AG-3 Rhs1AP]KEP51948.1 glycoside hydrolase family 79 protein [Rhizoctonia solani 123E]
MCVGLKVTLGLHRMHKSIFLALASAVAAANVSLPVIPTSPPSTASQILDRRLASFSIEFSYLPSFGGNKTHPNELTRNLMNRLVERTGLGPDVRPGGITVDSSVFDPNAPALNLSLSTSQGIWRTTYGPAYFESYLVFPKTSRFILDVNLGNDSITIAQNQIEAGIKYLGWDRIFSIQLGNEPDHYSRPGWSSAAFTAKFLNWTSALTQSLNLPARIFQANGFAEDPTSSAPMTTVSTINEGIDKTGAIKLFDHHTYQYSTCDPARNAKATLEALVNHNNITTYLDLWKPQIAAARGVGKEFVIGEYSSISCSGKQNVSDTYGQAMWLADTILYAASLNVSRLYMHQGATLVLQSSQQANSPGFSWYDLWYPVPSERYGSARASPSYVAYLLVAEAVGKSGRSRLALIRDSSLPSTLAVYAIWDPSSRTNGIARMVILNMSLRRQDVAVDEVLAVTVDVGKYLRGGRTAAQVKRMSSPGVESKDSDRVTWAGQSYSAGVPVGGEVVEQLDAGKVNVRGSEGVLITF